MKYKVKQKLPQVVRSIALRPVPTEPVLQLHPYQCACTVVKADSCLNVRYIVLLADLFGSPSNTHVRKFLNTQLS